MNHRENVEISRLTREVADLRRRIAAIPSTWPVADTDDVWQLVDPGGASVLPPSGAYGVKKLTSTLASIAAIANLSSPGVLQDGVGIAQNQRTAALAIVLNDARSRIRRDIYIGEVFSVARFSVLITSTTTYAQVIAPSIIRG